MLNELIDNRGQIENEVRLTNAKYSRGTGNTAFCAPTVSVLVGTLVPAAQRGADRGAEGPIFQIQYSILQFFIAFYSISLHFYNKFD